MLEFIDKHTEFAVALALGAFFIIVLIIVRVANFVDGVARAKGLLKDAEPCPASLSVQAGGDDDDDDDDHEGACVSEVTRPPK